MDRIKITNLYNLNETIAKDLFQKYEYPFEVLPNIEKFIKDYIKTLNIEEYDINGDIAISKSATIHSTAVIAPPAIIGANTEIRPNAFIRGKVIIGENCVIGNSCEFKNSIIFNNAQIPHFNYVGDSIIGFKSHLSAGVITSNLKSDQTNITVKIGNKTLETNSRKIGALIGDRVEVGCNSVLNPGTIIGRNTNIYPLSNVRGYIPADSIYKDKNNIVPKK